MPFTGRRWAAAFPWNALLCGRRFAVPEITPVAVTAERVTGGNLGRGDPEAVVALGPHLDQVPGLRRRFPHNRDSGGASRACTA